MLDEEISESTKFIIIQSLKGEIKAYGGLALFQTIFAGKRRSEVVLLEGGARILPEDHADSLSTIRRMKIKGHY